ncbi:unnamed protein product [Phaedon cochleariae]|uniref:Uncharacterized protein n=1 Tax=Phaedon cochleariae TaxID=80249 RepID=A0A9N9SLX2_PHACE|nr:unnamed protein product [Phaedon cochleariae]
MIVKDKLICVKCKFSFHPGCWKQSLTGKNPECLHEGEMTVTSECEDAAFFDALDEMTNTNPNFDIVIFKYILKQKDLLIQELRDKITMLNNQIGNMVVNNNYSPTPIMIPQKPDTEKDAKKPPSKKELIAQGATTSDKPVANKNTGISKTITKQDLSREIHKIESEQKLDKYINLGNITQQRKVDKNPNDKIISNSDEPEDSNWKTVKPRRNNRRSMIIGNNYKDSSIRGVPKYVDLHVCRLDTSTTSEDLENLLKKHFTVFVSFLVSLTIPIQCMLSVMENK